ncbi:MAG TPA: ankyrin repeat domain-containing protein [Thermoanaerobaculia bacterium]|nr:ankyrin repeat domain-containing protein [Thermoanaerobaculia bacterium]
MRLIVRVALVLLFATSAHAARKPKLPPLEPLIERAKANVLAGTYDVQRDLAPLLQRLATTPVEEEQDDVIDLIEELGEHDAITPAAVKTYLREAAPPVLMNVARTSPFKSIRGDAILVLRDLNVDAPVIDEAVAISKADAERSVQFHGRLLEQWKDSRHENYVATPTANEQAALEYLRRRRERVSAYTLAGAARNGDAELVAALLDAGVPVDVPQIVGTALGEAAGTGCITNPNVQDRLATIDLLIARGANVKWKDGNDNTLLMFALDCPPAVVTKLLDAGVSIDAVNAMKFNALQMAFAKGNWEVAQVLVERGARLTKKQIDELFFEKPDDPEKIALLKRATKK